MGIFSRGQSCQNLLAELSPPHADHLKDTMLLSLSAVEKGVAQTRFYLLNNTTHLYLFSTYFIVRKLFCFYKILGDNALSFLYFLKLFVF